MVQKSKEKHFFGKIVKTRHAGVGPTFSFLFWPTNRGEPDNLENSTEIVRFDSEDEPLTLSELRARAQSEAQRRALGHVYNLPQT